MGRRQLRGLPRSYNNDELKGLDLATLGNRLVAVADPVRSIGDYVEGDRVLLFAEIHLLDGKKSLISHGETHTKTTLESSHYYAVLQELRQKEPAGRYRYKRRAAPYLLFLPKAEEEEVGKKHTVSGGSKHEAERQHARSIDPKENCRLRGEKSQCTVLWNNAHPQKFTRVVLFVIKKTISCQTSHPGCQQNIHLGHTRKVIREKKKKRKQRKNRKGIHAHLIKVGI